MCLIQQQAMIIFAFSHISFLIDMNNHYHSLFSPFCLVFVCIALKLLCEKKIDYDSIDAVRAHFTIKKSFLCRYSRERCHSLSEPESFALWTQTINKKSFQLEPKSGTKAKKRVWFIYAIIIINRFFPMRAIVKRQKVRDIFFSISVVITGKRSD